LTLSKLVVMNSFPIQTDTGSGEKLLISGKHTDEQGEYLSIEGVVEPGIGPPMHVHFFQDEQLTVKEGLLGYKIAGEEVGYAKPGETVLFKAGQVHRFWNAGKVTMTGEGIVRPPGNFAWFIKHLHDSIKENGGKRPGLYDGAFLMERYKSEFEMTEMPFIVRKLIIPIVYKLGKLKGKYKKFKNAPEAIKSN
jgi:quercetin dioxygenase-like cupin family protein